MLEEDNSAMEKKGSTRQSSVASPKSNGSSDKKNDNPNKFHRNNNRKRETAGNSRGGSDNGTRKPALQKSRSAGDKRPRSRTFNPFDRQREEVAEKYMNEQDFAYRSKKGNLNHLLNFSYAPREVDAYVGGSVRRTNTSGCVRFNKKQFLQANCQFIVQDTGDYSIHSTDPDILVDWNLVELVRLYSYEKPLCPICLDSPVAAKVTRCGHIYCWSCILHLLSLEDGTWAECPICYSPVVDTDIRSAESVIVKTYKVGDRISMKLMKREPGSTYSVPKDNWLNTNGKPHRIYDDEKVTKYVKLLVASPSDILSYVIEREKTSLEIQLMDTEASEVCFIETAQVQLKERETRLLIKADIDMKKVFVKKPKVIIAEEESNTKTPQQMDTKVSDADGLARRVKTISVSSSTSVQSDDYPVITAGSESSISDTDCINELTDLPKSQSMPSELCQGAACAAAEIDSMIPEELFTEPEMSTTDMKNSVRKTKNLCASRNGYFCFQAADGQQIYIHMLNSRCLMHEFGCLELSPTEIAGNIIDIRCMNMTEELRARTKYLSHLPLSSEFLVVELDLKPPVLSRRTLDLFKGEIEQKNRMRQKKARTEEKREKKLFLEENKKLGIYPELRISLESEYQFPSNLNLSDLPCLPSRTTDVMITDLPSSSFQTSDIQSRLSTPEDQQFMSFAQMLRNGPHKIQVPLWPKLGSKEESSVLEDAPAYVDSDGSETEDYISVPEYGKSFGNAIKAALDNSVSTKTASKASKPKGKKNKNKNKNKNKKTTVLFSTSMTRGNTD